MAEIKASDPKALPSSYAPRSFLITISFTSSNWQELTSYLSYRQPNENIFNFQSTTPPRRPRLWDRAPQSPFAAHPRGRKVWKRYDFRVVKTETKSRPETTPGIDAEEAEKPSNGARPVKRLRVKQAPFVAGEVQNQKPAARYIATLQDKAPGTPRSESCILQTSFITIKG